MKFGKSIGFDLDYTDNYAQDNTFQAQFPTFVV